MNTLNEYLEKVLEVYSSGTFYEEVKKAKEDYLQKTGKVAEGSENYETYMQAFVDWYLFDRPLSASELPPIKMFLVDKGKTISPEDWEIYNNIAKSTHSLYEFIKIKGSDVFVKDLFEDEKMIVEDSHITVGFTKGDIFEGRLIEFKGRLMFGNSFLFHPVDCRSYIVKQVKKVKNLGRNYHLKLLHHLAQLKRKTEQYPHIDVRNIYAESSIF